MNSRDDVIVFIFLTTVVFIVNFLKISISVVMWEKESDTRCLLRWTVFQLVQNVLFSKAEAREITLYQLV